jgi:23S rRNA pseudouridine2605 synthase
VVTAPAKVEMARGGENPWYELTLTEGRNRQIRKMFEEIGHHVEKIRRIGYGALRLDVPPGGFRELTMGEVMALERASQGRKVVPKRNLPEYAQLKAPAKKRRR